MVERSLCMREVPGSIPGVSIPFCHAHLSNFVLKTTVVAQTICLPARGRLLAHIIIDFILALVANWSGLQFDK